MQSKMIYGRRMRVDEMRADRTKRLPDRFQFAVVKRREENVVPVHCHALEPLAKPVPEWKFGRKFACEMKLGTALPMSDACAGISCHCRRPVCSFLIISDEGRRAGRPAGLADVLAEWCV